MLNTFNSNNYYVVVKYYTYHSCQTITYSSDWTISPTFTIPPDDTNVFRWSPPPHPVFVKVMSKPRIQYQKYHTAPPSPYSSDWTISPTFTIPPDDTNVFRWSPPPHPVFVKVMSKPRIQYQKYHTAPPSPYSSDWTISPTFTIPPHDTNEVNHGSYLL